MVDNCGDWLGASPYQFYILGTFYQANLRNRTIQYWYCPASSCSDGFYWLCRWQRLWHAMEQAMQIDRPYIKYASEIN
jgi:hypothetical protein